MKKYSYIILCFILLHACGNTDKQAETDTEDLHAADELLVSKAQFEGEKMKLGTLEKHEFFTSIKANGEIEVPSQNKSSISPFVGGYVTKAPLLIGDSVKKGQFLVSLENTEYVELQQNYLEVAEQLKYLKSEFDRQKTLYDEKITAQKTFLMAESTYKSMQAQYNGMRKKLQMLNINPKSVEQGAFTSVVSIFAPIDGFVSRINISIGSFVSPADVIMEIMDTSHTHLELSIFEKDILHIKKGQSITFRIPEASDQVFNAEVHLVGAAIDPQNRRVTVHGHIDEADANFVVGMFAEAEIHIDSYEAWALPLDAIVQTTEGFVALALMETDTDGYHLEKISVKKGRETDSYVEVLNPEVFKNLNLVISGTYMLLNESEGGHSH